MAKPKHLDPCEVTWIDAHGSLGWVSLDELELGVRTVVSVGFLVSEDDDQVLVATSYDHETGSVADVTAIPKVCVSKPIRKLGPG